ncbi:MAG: NADH-quinone oxidoreductase subunit H [Actinomycetota bacterium]
MRTILYVLLILAINLYLGSYLVSKLSARAELRRGHALSRFGSITYPYFKLLKYLSKESSIMLWDVLLFLFAILVWSVVPITFNLVVMDIGSGFFTSALFYLIVLVMLVFSSQSKYEFQLGNVLREAGMAGTFFLPVLLSFFSIMLINRTIVLREIVNLQYVYWNIVYQPLGFFIVLVSAILQVKILGLTRKNVTLTSRMLERQGGGFPTAISRFAKYTLVFYLVAMINIFYLGGWLDLHFIDGNILLAIKFYIIFIFILLFDKALPEIDNYKYLVDINWKFLVPVSVFNFVLTIAFLILRNLFGMV